MSIETSAEIGKLAAALVLAQGRMEGAPKDRKNPHFKSSYATLESVIETAKPALQAAGLAFSQGPGGIIDGAIEVTTMLMHGESGQWLRSTLHVPLAKRDPQGVGSAITYGCRYSLMAALGLPPIDDDGEAAHGRQAGSGDRQNAGPNSGDLAKSMLDYIPQIQNVQRANQWWDAQTSKGDDGKLPFDKLSEADFVRVRDAYNARYRELERTAGAGAGR